MGVTDRSSHWIGTALAAAICAPTEVASACGLEEPSAIVVRRGSLNLAYPESLHVGTALWPAEPKRPQG